MAYYTSKMGNRLLYKWEDNNHGLEHKCGTCKTVLSSPRAKTTCFGKHEEVCRKYHKTLFYLGNSHKCDACRKSLELHDKRHREIAVLVQRIRRLDDAITIPSPLSTKKRKTRKSEVPELFSTAIGCIEEELAEGDEEWADSSTIFDDESDIKRLCSSSAKESRSIKKAQKAVKKITKNQLRVQIITSEDIVHISQALHPLKTSLVGETDAGYDGIGNGQGLLNNSTIDANIAFNTGTFQYASLRQDISVKKLAKAQGIGTPKTPDENSSWQEDPQIVETLGRLKIAVVTRGPSSRNKKSLLSKLCDAVHNDLLILENEDRDTMMRMAGYWRYVNKRTYNAMIRNNQLWDWATGAKLEEIEEVDEDDEAQVEQANLLGGLDTQEVGNDDRRPVECYDADFPFAETDGQVLVLRKSVDDEKEPVEGEFEGKADTRHLTSVHCRTSSPPEPISPCLRHQAKAAKEVFPQEADDDMPATGEKEREYYNQHYDYDFGADLDYYQKQSTNHQNSAAKSLRPPRAPISTVKPIALTFPRRRGFISATPTAAAPTVPTPQRPSPRLARPRMVEAPQLLTSKLMTTPKATTTPKALTPRPKAKILRITIPKFKPQNAKSPRAKAARTMSAPPGQPPRGFLHSGFQGGSQEDLTRAETP